MRRNHAGLTARPASLRRRAATVAVGALAIAGILQPVTARATTTITTYHLASIGYSSFAVTANSLGSGWSYRLYASTTKSNVYATNLAKALHSPLSSTPTTKLTSLRYTTAPYWYRVVGTKGTSRRTGPMASVGLRPTAPTSFAITNTAARLPQLHWSSVTTTGFQIQQATNTAFTTGLHTYTTRDNLHRFTPYLVSNGTLYFYRVRGANNGTHSSFSPVVGSRAKASETAVKVLTYNVLANTADGSREGGNTVAAWHTARRDGAASLIQQGGADLVSVQEASGWALDPSDPACRSGGCLRMVDDLVNALGGQYALAQTEPTPGTPGWERTGDYLLYNTATYAPIGAGGNFVLNTSPAKKWAVYQLVENLSTHAQLLFVGTHLIDGSSSYDSIRQNETTSMLSQVNAYRSAHGNPPVVYAGDFNSHPYAGHVDGPGVVMWQNGIATAEDVAQSVTNGKYNSANQYLSVPPAFSDNIDHVFVPQGEGVISWKLLINLVSGKLVMPIPSDHNPLVVSVAVPY